MNKVHKLNGFIYVTSEESSTVGKQSLYGKKVILSNDNSFAVQQLTKEEEDYCNSVDEVKAEKRYSDFTVNPFVGYKLIIPTQEEVRKENLEELAERMYPINNTGIMFMANKEELNNSLKQEGFIEGAKWQAKQMYTEDEVFEILSKFRELRLIEFQEWFNQFKKQKQ